MTTTPEEDRLIADLKAKAEAYQRRDGDSLRADRRAFRAAANPAAILSLIAVIERLKGAGEEAAYKRGWNDRESDILERAERIAPPASAPDLGEVVEAAFKAGIEYAAQEMDGLSDPGSDHGAIEQAAHETYGCARDWLKGLDPREVRAAALLLPTRAGICSALELLPNR